MTNPPSSIANSIAHSIACSAACSVALRAPGRTARQTHAGFTLVEVLVALVIMSVLAMMAWQGVDGITRARATSEAMVERTLRLDTVLAQWEQDLSSIEDSQVVPALAFDGAAVRLTRRQDGGMQLVTWALRNGTLMRWTGPAVTDTEALQQSWLRSQQLLGTENEQLRTIEGLREWQVYFFRNSGWTNAQSTGDLRPATGTADPGAAPRTVLPTGVRMVLTFAEGSGLSGQLTRDIRLSPQAVQ